jgi:hypothetical protein
MSTLEDKIASLRSMSQKEYTALTDDQQRELMNKVYVLEEEREANKKAKAEIGDVLDSMIEIAKQIPDVDMTKAEAFSTVLLRNKITKWELRVATEEIIRSRTRFTAVAEYFLAISRLKARLQESGHNIFHDNALDF